VIIALYESIYPIAQAAKPNWEDLPVGYFSAEGEMVQDLIVRGPPGRFSGVFSVCRGKPRVGEHLLAVFGLSGTWYHANATLSYRSELDVVDSDEWSAELGFANVVRSGKLTPFSP
jgi:hypothetical protein